MFGLDVTASFRNPKITGLNKTSSFCLRLHEVPMSRLVWEFCFTEASGVKGVLLLPAHCSALPASSVWPASLSSKLVDKEKGIKKPRTHASYFLGKVLRSSNTTLSHHFIGKNVVTWPHLPTGKTEKCLYSGWLCAQLKLYYYRIMTLEAIRGLW